jgi:molecular chaperone DnaJ
MRHRTLGMNAGTAKDYYDILGVPRNADQNAIKDAFRRLALKYHPDRNKEPGAEDRFKEMVEAYAILADPKKRAAYDARGRAGVEGFSPEDLFGGIDFEDLFGGFDFGFGGGLFDRIFRRRPHGPARGDNVEIELEIPLERVLHGGEETVRFERFVACPTCSGSGAAPGHPPRNCATCGGTGQKVAASRRGGVTFTQITPCPDCRGRGSMIDETCARCRGSGEIAQAEELRVRIPVGVEEGMALRIPRHGMPAPEAGGEPGDLFVMVRTAANTHLERRGADLWHTETIDVSDAALGTKLEVATLDGSLTVRVPPGTQPEEALRLRGQGLPSFGGGKRGDLFVRVHVHVPERLSRKQRALFEDLRRSRKP